MSNARLLLQQPGPKAPGMVATLKRARLLA
jgi:hypothetical protein